MNILDWLTLSDLSNWIKTWTSLEKDAGIIDLETLKRIVIGKQAVSTKQFIFDLKQNLKWKSSGFTTWTSSSASDKENWRWSISCVGKTSRVFLTKDFRKQWYAAHVPAKKPICCTKKKWLKEKCFLKFCKFHVIFMSRLIKDKAIKETMVCCTCPLPMQKARLVVQTEKNWKNYISRSIVNWFFKIGWGMRHKYLIDKIYSTTIIYNIKHQYHKLGAADDSNVH